MQPRILIIGTGDTKADELEFMRAKVAEAGGMRHAPGVRNSTSSKRFPSRSPTSPGKRRVAYANGIGSSAPAESGAPSQPSPSHASSPRSSGPSVGRCRSKPRPCGRQGRRRGHVGECPIPFMWPAPPTPETRQEQPRTKNGNAVPNPRIRACSPTSAAPSSTLLRLHYLQPSAPRLDHARPKHLKRSSEREATPTPPRPQGRKGPMRLPW